MLLKSLNIAGFKTKTHQKSKDKTHKAVKPCKQYNADISEDSKAAAANIINT